MAFDSIIDCIKLSGETDADIWYDKLDVIAQNFSSPAHHIKSVEM